MLDRESEDLAITAFPLPFTENARNAALPPFLTTPAPPAAAIRAEL